MLVDMDALRPGDLWCVTLYRWLREADAAIVLINQRAIGPSPIFGPRSGPTTTTTSIRGRYGERWRPNRHGGAAARAAGRSGAPRPDRTRRSTNGGAAGAAAVLIDEADPDLPNALLVPLGTGEFTVAETGSVVRPRPLPTVHRRRQNHLSPGVPAFAAAHESPLAGRACVQRPGS